MLTKLLAKTEGEALSTAVNVSIKNPTTELYLFFCEKSSEYSISDIETPYAPIILGGYVPTRIASFLNGKAT